MTETARLLEKAARSFQSAERQLAAVVAQYGLRFSQTEKLDRKFHRALIEAFRLRQFADYQTEVPINSEVVEDLIREGRLFLAVATRYIAEHPENREGGERGNG